MIKTNSGKIFVITSKSKDEVGATVYEERFYATCEKHARQIFEALFPDSEITDIYEDSKCYSQHYPENEDSTIPEISLAEKLMYAMMMELSKDKEVYLDDTINVIDTACAMTKMMLTKTFRESKEAFDTRPKDE